MSKFAYLCSSIYYDRVGRTVNNKISFSHFFHLEYKQLYLLPDYLIVNLPSTVEILLDFQHAISWLHVAYSLTQS